MSTMSPVNNVVEVLRSFTDVLYFTDKGQIPLRVKRLLKQKKLSLAALPISEFPEIRHRLDLIGTVIIDTMGLQGPQQHKLAQIIEVFEMNNIGIILLSDEVDIPVKNFPLTPERTRFSAEGMTEPDFIDKLWVKISVNLAYRKKNTGIVVKPATTPRHYRVHGNKLAEQLLMTEALVDNLSEQLSMAGLVQRDFLPAQLPDTDNIKWASKFLPAEWVSGDIYDAVRLDEDNIGFYVADVVGHGMPAALLTIFLKQALIMRRTIGNNYTIFSPSEVMKNLNQRMIGQKLSGYQFATCCYCLLNTRTMELTYARAGHPYPLLIRQGQRPEQLEVRGSLLGIFEGAEFVQQTVQLQKGDKLLIYSDGAEPYIGRFQDKDGFKFRDQFRQIIDFSIDELLDKFCTIIQDLKIDPAEIDDITALGFEIL